MKGNVPDISQLMRLPSDSWSEFGKRLRACGLNSQYRGELLGSRLKIFDTLQGAILRWRAQHSTEPKAVAFRMFFLRDPVTHQETVELLGPKLTEELLEVGCLVCTAEDLVVSPFEMRVFEDLYILCDDLSHRGDAVYGAGPGTYAFPGLVSPDTQVNSALDLGCGAGAATLWLSKYAQRVHATDINPRALPFLKINAAINGITNFEGFVGDWFTPVEGKKYDLIICQPPFTPLPPEASPATYRYGGRVGNEHALTVIREAPKYLTQNGHAMIVFEQPVFNDSDADAQGAVFEVEADVKTLVLVGETVDADAYSVRHAASELRHGLEAFNKEAVEMREHLAALNIKGIQPAICVLERTMSERGWLEIVNAGQALWSEISPNAIQRLFAGFTLVQQRPGLPLRGVVDLPGKSFVIQHFQSTDPEAERIAIVLPSGYIVRSLELTKPQWELLQQLVGTKSAADFSAAQDQDLVLQTMLKLLRAGLVDVQNNYAVDSTAAG